MKKTLPMALVLFCISQVALSQNESQFISYSNSSEIIYEKSHFTKVKAEPTIPEISITPNPTKGLFKINVNNLQEKENLQIEILNAYGKRIFLEKMGISGAAIEYSFDLIPMKAGVYTVKVSQNGRINIVKLIKE